MQSLGAPLLSKVHLASFCLTVLTTCHTPRRDCM